MLLITILGEVAQLFTRVNKLSFCVMMAICVHMYSRAISAKAGPTNSKDGKVRKNPLNL